ncbi:MAG: pantoate--beta-alanine ligase [Lentisphaeria bacterium]|nr:pantoate--beta-alanine ligase [Lentisphaeria bacterium]
MRVCRGIQEIRDIVSGWRRRGDRVGFVPTMGYLHEGHLSLVDWARKSSSRVVVSIYVNPTQFGANEDYGRYPRDPDRDEVLCLSRGVDAVFYPDEEGLYAPDHSTWVLEECLSQPLCGRSRPGHFRGVTTVVTKLFHIVQPDVAVFGQKDAQQALVVQRMVRDLDFPVRVVVAPIVREPDGLAMSSRNTLLSGDERQRAPALFRGLSAAAARYDAGEREAAALCAVVTDVVTAAGGTVDYVELVSRETLRPAPRLEGPTVLAVAAWFGRTRLIDNVFLG